MAAWHKYPKPAVVSPTTLVTLEALAADGFIIFRNEDGNPWKHNSLNCENLPSARISILWMSL